MAWNNNAKYGFVICRFIGCTYKLRVTISNALVVIRIIVESQNNSYYNSGKQDLDTFVRVYGYNDSFTVKNDYAFIFVYSNKMQATITRSSGKTVTWLWQDNDCSSYIAKDVTKNEIFTSDSGFIQYMYPVYRN